MFFLGFIDEMGYLCTREILTTKKMLLNLSIIRRCLFVLLMTILPLTANGITGKLYEYDKLTNSLVTQLCQDKYGYVWIASDFGLNRFDGYHFVNYYYSSRDSLSIYINKVDGKDAKWIFLPDLGCGEGCMGSDNVVAASDLSGNGAALEYDIDLKTDMVAIGILPTQDIRPERGLRLGVQIDNQPMQIIDARQGIVDTFGEYTPQNLAVSKVLKPQPAHNGLLLSGWYKGKRLPRRDEVFDNLRWLNVPLNVSPGKHTLRIVMIDPEIVVEQIVVNPDNNHYSYFGAKEK